MNRLARVVWVAGAPVRWLLLAGIRGYRATLSGLLGGQCRFYPTCSAYAEDAIRARGAIRGSGLAIWRILRCNPYGAGGIDHAPSPHRDAYDDVLPTFAGEAREADAATDRVNA